MENMVKPKFFAQAEAAPKAFITQAWQQQLDLIIHQCKVSQNVMLVVAPQGGGKTTFAQHFLQIPTPGLRKFSLTAQQNMSLEAWMQNLVGRFEIQWHGMEISKQELQATVEEISHHHQQTCVLLIDDAHHLNDEQLYCLLQLIQTQGASHHQLHVMLLGEPSLDFRLSSPVITSDFQGKIYTVDLEPWNLRDINAFFAQDALSPQLSHDQISLIFDRTRGLPGYVIREKDNVLAQRKPAIGKKRSASLKRWPSHPAVVGVVMGCVVGGGYLLFGGSKEQPQSTVAPVNMAQTEQNQWDEANQLAQVPQTDSSLTFTETPITQEPLYIAAEAAPPLAENNPVSAPAQAQPEPIQAQNAPVVAEEKIQLAQVATVVAQAPKELSPPAPKAKAERKKPAQKTITTKKSTVARKKSAEPKAQQIANVKQKYYTLQLLGAYREDAAKKFIQQHALNNKAMTYRTQRDGQDWYVVVYGQYPTPAAAKAAISKIPASLKKQRIQPWVRGLNTLQG
jgi:DamX protein